MNRLYKRLSSERAKQKQ